MPLMRWVETLVDQQPRISAEHAEIEFADVVEDQICPGRLEGEPLPGPVDSDDQGEPGIAGRADAGRRRLHHGNVPGLGAHPIRRLGEHGRVGAVPRRLVDRHVEQFGGEGLRLARRDQCDPCATGAEPSDEVGGCGGERRSAGSTRDHGVGVGDDGPVGQCCPRPAWRCPGRARVVGSGSGRTMTLHRALTGHDDGGPAAHSDASA